MNKIKRFMPVLFTLCIVFIFYFKRYTPLKLYPPICNFCIFLLFFTSLFSKETIIQKFVRLTGERLEGAALTYTRNITYVWCAFTFINFLISVWTLFLSDEIWMIYNGLISYILVGLVFGIEYIVRIVLRKNKKI